MEPTTTPDDVHTGGRHGAAAALSVRVFGQLSVALDGEPVAVTPRATGLLVRLALADGPVARERLLVDLWGDDVDPGRMRSLETLVSTIRRATGRTDAVEFVAGAYRLGLQTDVDAASVLAFGLAARAGRATVSERGAAAVVARRGASMVARLGASAWIDELERALTDAVDALGAVGAERLRPLPEVRYTLSDDGHLAYQLRPGRGVPVLLLAGLATHCEGLWEAPGFVDWVDASFGERPLLLFDKRGTGLSDPIGATPSDDDFRRDAEAVLAAAEFDRVVLVCASEAGMFGPHIAAERPECVAGVVFVNAVPRMFESGDYPHGIPERVARAFGESVRRTWARDDDVGLALSAPDSANDARFRQWALRYQRMTATPGSIAHLVQYTGDGDGREAVASIGAPALVLQSRDSAYFRPSSAEWLAERLGVEPVWLAGANHLFWVADPSYATATIAEFLDQIDSFETL